MSCPGCHADMIPHEDDRNETTWICPVCGEAIFGLAGYELESIREYWLDRTLIL